MRFTSFAKALAAVCLGMVLSGCVAGGTGSSPDSAQATGQSQGQSIGFLSGLKRESKTIRGQTKRRMAGGDVIAMAPQSYCFDPSVTGSARFALLADCATLQNAPDTPSFRRGLLSLSISAAAPAAAVPVSLDDAVPGTRITSTIEGLHLKKVTASEAPIAGADSTYWRGVMAVNNRILVFSAYAPQGGNLSGKAGQSLIEAFASQTRKASPKAKAPLFSGKNTVERKENAQDLQFGAIGRLFQRNQSDTQ